MQTQNSQLKDRLNLTKRAVDAAVLPSSKKQHFIMDANLPGFGLRITATTKTFILNRRLNGRPVRIMIGRYGPWTVEEARARAKKLMQDMDTGKDPRLEKKRLHHEPTYEDMVEAFAERHASKIKSGKDYIDWLRCYSSDWKPKRVSEISYDLVATRHRSLSHKPYAANRWLAIIRLMFNKAHRWEEFSEYIHDNPAVGVERFKEKSRTRFVTPEELPILLAALNSLSSPTARAAILLTLWTAARPTEIYGMRWADIDLEQATWNKPETKSGENHLVPLSPTAIKVIESLPRINQYVLPNQAGTGPIKSPRKSWRLALEQSGLKNLRHRDLRRTMASWLAAQGESLVIIGKLLDHKTPQATAIYARLNLGSVRVALNKVTAQMEAMAVANQPVDGSDADA